VRSSDLRCKKGASGFLSLHDQPDTVAMHLCGKWHTHVWRPSAPDVRADVEFIELY
jgi:hypothetical protein